MARILEVTMNDGAEKWVMALKGLSEQRVKDEVVKPGFTKLGYMLTRSLADEFSDTSKSGMGYLGGMESGFKLPEAFKATGTVLEIKDAARHGAFIREGIKPWFAGNMYEAIHSGEFPGPVVAWAIDKLGVSKNIAMRIAFKIMTKGTGVSKDSLMRKKWPAGQSKFTYHDYVVEEKNKDEIDEIVQGMAQGIPTLIHKLIG